MTNVKSSHWEKWIGLFGLFAVVGVVIIIGIPTLRRHSGDNFIVSGKIATISNPSEAADGRTLEEVVILRTNGGKSKTLTLQLCLKNCGKSSVTLFNEATLQVGSKIWAAGKHVKNGPFLVREIESADENVTISGTVLSVGDPKKRDHGKIEQMVQIRETLYGGESRRKKVQLCLSNCGTIKPTTLMSGLALAVGGKATLAGKVVKPGEMVAYQMWVTPSETVGKTPEAGGAPETPGSVNTGTPAVSIPDGEINLVGEVARDTLMVPIVTLSPTPTISPTLTRDPALKAPMAPVATAAPLRTCDDLQAIGSTGAYYLDQDIDCSASVKWKGGLGFNPIGAFNNPFSGTLDGRGHSITGLYINRIAEDAAGLFRYSGSGATIRNLRIINSNIRGAYWIGILVGHADSGTSIESVKAEGTINGNSAVISGIGGIAGYNRGTIRQSSATVTIVGRGTIGGLVGANESFGGEIVESFALGEVSGTYALGGLVGQNRGSISDSYANVKVTADRDPSGTVYAGGLIGRNTNDISMLGTVTRAYSVGSVSGATPFLRGFCGQDLGLSSNSYFDKDSSGTTISGSGGGVAGLTTSAMKQRSSFIGWDFATIWKIDENQSYPQLRSNTDKKSDLTIIALSVVDMGTDISDSNRYLASESQPLSFKIGVENDGETTAGESKLALYINGNRVSNLDTALPLITSGDSQEFILSSWPAVAGEYTVEARADADNVVEESDESNNSMSVALTVTPQDSCNNGICDNGETCTSCQADCGACAPQCVQDADCSDSNICTNDYCNDGSCQNDVIGSCCQADSDCNGGQVCKQNRCVTPPQCTVDSDCPQPTDDPCAKAVCNDSNICENQPTHAEGCPYCGNNICDSGEDYLSCPSDCQAMGSCGDGTIDSGEECDDGNDVDGDGCSSACQVETESCPEGYIEAEGGCFNFQWTISDWSSCDNRKQTRSVQCIRTDPNGESSPADNVIYCGEARPDEQQPCDCTNQPDGTLCGQNGTCQSGECSEPEVQIVGECTTSGGLGTGALCSYRCTGAAQNSAAPTCTYGTVTNRTNGCVYGPPWQQLYKFQCANTTSSLAPKNLSLPPTLKGIEVMNNGSAQSCIGCGPLTFVQGQVFSPIQIGFSGKATSFSIDPPNVGFDISATGVISGTPTSTSTTRLAVIASNSFGSSTPLVIPIQVVSASSVTITNPQMYQRFVCSGSPCKASVTFDASVSGTFTFWQTYVGCPIGNACWTWLGQGSRVTQEFTPGVYTVMISGTNAYTFSVADPNATYSQNCRMANGRVATCPDGLACFLGTQSNGVQIASCNVAP